MPTESIVKRILLWLISIYIKPVSAETKTITEVDTMTDQVVDIPATTPTDSATVTLQTSGDVTISSPELTVTGNIQQSVSGEVKAGVADFEAALSFVESGVAQLGEAAKDELKELAKKYL